jgi:DNA-binding transcriptional ArsR family regulator
MSDAEPTPSPLEAVEESAGDGVVAAFGLLANETRLAILLALWDAYDPEAETSAVPFSDLRERVAMRDSGQFNYHLGKLESHFVRKTADGYTLRPLGLNLIQTLIAGVAREETLDSSAVDIPCHICGSDTAISYQDGWLYHRCTECEGGLQHSSQYPEGTLFAEPLPPAALWNRTPEELFAAGIFRLLQVMSLKLGHLCPNCSGVIESTMEVCDDHVTTPGEVCDNCHNTAAVRIKWYCEVCKYAGGSSPAGVVIVHPAVISFYQAHGVRLGYESRDFESAKRLLALLRNHEQELISVDPVRVLVTVRLDGDELQLTLDDQMNVVETTHSTQQ